MFNVLCRPDLSRTAKLVYALLHSSAGRPRVTKQDISSYLKLSVRSVERALAELIPQKLILVFGWPHAFVPSSEVARIRLNGQPLKYENECDMGVGLYDTDDEVSDTGVADHDTDDEVSDTGVDIDDTHVEVAAGVAEDDPLFQEMEQAANEDQEPEHKPTPVDLVASVLKKSKEGQDKLARGVDPKELSHSLYSLSHAGPAGAERHVLLSTLLPEGKKGMQEEHIGTHSSELYINNIKNLTRDLSTTELSVFETAGSVVQPCQDHYGETNRRGAPPPGAAGRSESLPGCGPTEAGGTDRVASRTDGGRVQTGDHGRVRRIKAQARLGDGGTSQNGGRERDEVPHAVRRMCGQRYHRMAQQSCWTNESCLSHVPRIREGERNGHTTEADSNRGRAGLPQAGVRTPQTSQDQPAGKALDRNREAGDEVVSKLDQLREKARAKAKNRIKTPPKKVDPAQEMAYAYETVLGEYSLKPTLKFIKTWDPEHINVKYFRKAAAIADEIGAPYEQFVWAQFHFIHKWFGRSTKPYELRSTKGKLSACERHSDYKKLLKAGEIEAKCYTSSFPIQEIDPKKLAKINQKRLNRIMTKWGVDEAGAIAKFHSLFDLRWLKKNPTYRQLRKDGLLLDP